MAARLATSEPGKASHPYWFPIQDPGHIESINFSDIPEAVCVDIQTQPAIDYQTAWYRIGDALYYAVPDGEDSWDGLNNDKINFTFAHHKEYEMLGQGCFAPPPADPLVWEIRIAVKDDVTSNCNGNSRGCAFRNGPMYGDPSTSGHSYGEYQNSQIYIATGELLSDSYLFIINHEVGHALGLADGGPDAPDEQNANGTQIPLPSQTQNPLSCSPISIMHVYGCDETDWPSAVDRAALEFHIPNGQPAGGGGSGATANKGFF
ncbi:MAG: hypothetical protein WD904_04405 [Dehalococcoidia bacterium]